MSNKDIKDKLFSDELEIFKLAKSNLLNEKYKENTLLESYRTLVFNYEKLLRLARKAIKISDFQWKELRRREYEIRNLLDNSNQGFLTFGKDLIVNREYSSECIRLFGRKIVNMSILELLHSENNDQNELFKSVFTKVFSTKDVEIKLSILKQLPTMLAIQGNYVNVTYKLIDQEDYTDENEVLMLILTDITEKKRSEDQILYLSYHDKLTGLYNRAYIDNVIPQLQTTSNMPLSVIIGDMNGLKLTNDVFGHEFGDKLLVNAAKVLLSCCRNTDIVARWGGDEFLIILPGANNAKCKEVCQRIKEKCKAQAPTPIELSLSLGVSTMETPNTSISEIFNIAENMMYSNKLIESKKVRQKIILSLEKTLNEKCFESTGHADRVRNMALYFGKILNFSSDSKELLNLSLLASLHDIGKVSIPKEILGKQESLTDSELEIIKSYTEIGYRMAQSIEEPILAQGILCLREKWDGTGYPYGLKDENIPMISRIISIIDAYDVMRHDRPYRKALSKDEALNELKRCSGTHFDPKLVDLFIRENIYTCI